MNQGANRDPIDDLIDADSKAFDDFVKKREMDKQDLDFILIFGRVCVGAVASLATYMAINGTGLHGFGIGDAITAAIAVAFWAMVIWWRSIKRDLLKIPAAISALIVATIAVDWIDDRFEESVVRICGEHFEEPCDRY